MERALDLPLTHTGRDAPTGAEPPAAAIGADDFSTLYKAEYEHMVRLAYVMLGSQEQAEDVVHDALARLIERWPRVDNHGAYLRASVVNGSRSVLRRRRFLRRDPPDDFDSATVDSDYVGDLLQGLPTKGRAVIVLRYFEQLTVPEIARTLGMREGTVKSTLHRTLGILRQEIQR